MSTKWRYCIILGAVVFFWSVIVNAPANIVGKLLQGKGIQALSYSGTLWQGQARGLSLMVADESIYLDQLEWDLYPMSLLFLTPTADISGIGPGLGLKGEVALLGDDHWRMEHADISFPAGMFGTTAMGSFAGAMNLQVNRLEVDKRTIKALKGRVLWQSARWLFEQRWWTLGSFAADLSNAAGGVSAEVFDQGGPIGLKGKVTVKLSGSYDFSGDVKPRATAPEELRSTLLVIGERQPDDSYRVSFQGAFPID